MQGKLLLTDKQKTDLYLILLDEYSKLDSLRMVKANQSVIKAQFNLTGQALQKVLTPDQITKYKAMRAQKNNQIKSN